jgi:hypothetical protein
MHLRRHSSGPALPAEGGLVDATAGLPRLRVKIDRGASRLGGRHSVSSECSKMDAKREP